MSPPLHQAIQEASSVVVITGAGISLASGIPTFRGSDPGAVWAKDVTELGTRRYFEQDPAGSWAWYRTRFGGLLGHDPNPAHHALVALEQWLEAQGRDFLLVTQNVDCLHEAAGSAAMVKVHGTADRVRCAEQDCDNGAPGGSIAMSEVDFSAFAADPIESNLPRCPLCRELLRPHILWFDEYYTDHRDYQIQRVRRAQKRARVTLFVGTSFSVGITEMAMRMALQRGQRIYSIDPVSRPPHPGVTWIAKPSEEALPALMDALRAG
ncbi:MAG: NAD-dependent deacetylase [Myxococcota bacterium]